jgi:hypothetical protein
MPKKPFTIPEELPVNPTSLTCPLCKAKPSQDCTTSSGGFSVLHVDRIKAAAFMDRTKKRRRENGVHASEAKNVVAKAMPAHLIELGGVKRCSVCKLAFNANSKPSLSRAFRKHVTDAHKV